MTDYGEWLLSLERDARRFSILFLHLGRAFSPLRTLLVDLQARIVPVDEYFSSSLPPGREMYVLDQIERLRPGRPITFGMLRERIVSDIDEGHVFLLVSTVARNAYESAPGSDLLADAKIVFAPPREPREQDPLDPPGDKAEESDESWLPECVSELGSRTVLKLSELIWESQLSPNETITALSNSDIECLRGAGLVVVAGGSASWALPSRWKALRLAIATEASRFTEAGSWLGQAFLDLWLIERMIRNAFRDALEAKLGQGWRDSCLPEGLAKEVLERARKDAQPLANRVRDLRDPLEWLSTSELLDLRETRQLGELGLEPYLWAKLREALVPIRNRAAHMRIISDGDARLLNTWRKMVLSRIADGGSRQPAKPSGATADKESGGMTTPRTAPQRSGERTAGVTPAQPAP